MFGALKNNYSTGRTARWLPAMSLFVLMINVAVRGGTYTVTTIADTGSGSLRQAITAANNDPGPNLISFQISGSGPFSIALTSALPGVTNTTTLDATTQPGFNGTPVVELNGAGTPTGTAGLQLMGSFNVVRGLAINRFTQYGLVLLGSSNVVQGNFIGTDVTGTQARGNTSFAIWVRSAGNLIGGTAATNRNVLSGNDTGIYFTAASNNVVQGNLVGVNVTGTAALKNVNNGIVLDATSTLNLIGGTVAGAGNVIAGNGASGVYLNGTNTTENWVQGNFIGTDITGENVISNAADGVTINGAVNNVIGGGNVISGNGKVGVSVYAHNGAGGSGNRVVGNFIGTDAAGKIALGNQDAGVALSAGATGNQIGDATAGDGNVISGNGQDGIFLTTGASGNLVQGNLLGLGAGGTNAVPNGFNGVSISGAVSNTIGGLTAGARNIISGNTGNGIGILQVADTGNTIAGNYIGTDITGLRAVPNTLAGVRIHGCSNVVGGVTTGSGNVISGNSQQGVWLVGTSGEVSGNVIQGNLIGLDVTGARSLGNGDAGVGITSAANNLVGGTAAGARNILSANTGEGVFILGPGATNNTIQGNFIGTDVTGMAAHGNGSASGASGLLIENTGGNQIGGGLAGAGNLISANNNRGIYLLGATNNVVQGNLVGTKADGVSALANLFHGVDIDTGSANNVIGGAVAGTGNTLAFAQVFQGYGYCGVRVRAGAVNNLISGNSIFSNTGLGIDLGTYGVNPNVDCGSGIGANLSENFPVLTNVISGAVTRVRGTLDSTAGRSYLLQFFASPTGDPSGYGEGQLFLGQTNVMLGVACSTNFTAYLPRSVPAGWVVTATATDPANNTSEFSAWVPALMVPPLQMTFTNVGGGQLQFVWTNTVAGLQLQQTFSLSSPVTWTAVTNQPVLGNGNYLVTLAATNANAFYRLTAP